MKNFAFRRPLYFWLGFVALFGLFLLIKSAGVSDKEGETLRNLVASSPKKIRKMKIRQKQELTKQTRWNVVKKIYIADKVLRREMRLVAKRSEVLVLSQRPHMHVSETFYEVQGIAQHELFYRLEDGTEVHYDEDGELKRQDLAPLDATLALQPMQRFRYFEAESAVYDFHTRELTARDVTFWTYTVSGHDVVQDRQGLLADAHGKASRMTLFINTQDTQRSFSADNLSVKFSTKRGL